MNRELLAYLIIALMVAAFVGLALHGRHNTRSRKEARQRDREREVRANRKSDQP